MSPDDKGVSAATPSTTEDRARSPILWIAGSLLPLLLLALVRLRPSLDARWESHPAHFWLVLAAAGISVVLGYSVSIAAQRRLDARLFFVSMAFLTTAGFLGLHALATPGVLVGPNAGFELATPVGLLLGGALVAVSALEMGPAASRRVIARSRWFLAALVILMVGWGSLSLAGAAPLDDPLPEEELYGWQDSLGVVGVALYAAGAFGYYVLYRRRKARFVFAAVFAFSLLAEAMIVIAFAVNWQLSWWEWHALMLCSFTIIALTARGEWHEERFSAIYLEHTLAGAKDVTVVFADLQGYTSYSERTNPSAVAHMLNDYFSRLVPLMQEMGGEVHQLIGDAVMVVFNKAGDQQEHALLAARAGLSFQREAASIAEDHPDWPRFRVGMNSGEVLVGVLGAESGHRQHGLVGDTVNLAARLEGQAPVGGVVIGAGTFERLPAGSSVERLAPLHIKGKKETVEAYVLKSVPNGSE
ncbi:MAG: adenylate/guanylate cyclase domain-containing protein [Actinomycetota bacterium]